MSIKFGKLRRTIGMYSLALSLVFILWLPLGVLTVVPLLLQIPGESALRTHAGVTVACLMVAAWGFWHN